MAEERSSKRAKLLADLRSVRGCTRTALAELLSVLHKSGELPSGLGSEAPRTLRHQFASAVEAELSCPTPYGCLVQSLPANEVGGQDLPFLDPCALMHHVARLSEPFFEILSSIGHPAHGLRIMLYIDEVKSGNPLRPAKGRTTQCVYWTFAELPAHLQVQTRMWFLFAALRSRIASNIPGGVSGLMSTILRKFFPADGSGMQRGILIAHRDRQHLLRACFGGFVADEKGLKEVFSYKGASGSKPCMTCSNLARFLDPRALSGSGIVDMSCADRSAFRYHSKATVLSIVDRLRAAKAARMPKAEYNRLEQAFGVTLEPAGILADAHCRSIVDPVAHYFRGWMHTIASNGVAGVEMTMCINRLVEAGFNHSMIARWAVRFNLPKARGKVDPDWFSPSRVGPSHCSTFASEQLSMLPLLLSFVDAVVAPALPDHRRCLRLLALIVQILSLGPRESIDHLRLLKESVVEHHQLFARLYPDAIKPKLHHLLHLPEDMERLGRLLSCFTMERKHRDTKRAALHVFRNFEATVMQELALDQVKSIVDGAPLHPMHLIDGSAVGAGPLMKASRCHLPCGDIHPEDIVVLRGGSVAIVDCCWGVDSSVLLQARLLPPSGNSKFELVPRGGDASFIDAAEVRSVAVWASDAPGVVRIIPPLI